MQENQFRASLASFDSKLFTLLLTVLLFQKRVTKVPPISSTLFFTR